MSQTPNKPADIHDIRAMFSGLNLPVCDDQAAIEAACDLQRDLRNRQLNSTKGSVAVAAQAWFDGVDALLKRRPELLEGLYEQFVSLADAVLVLAGAGGRRKLAGRARSEFSGLAMRFLGARQDLAAAWVERWLVERGAARLPGIAKTAKPAQSNKPAGKPAAAGAGAKGAKPGTTASRQTSKGPARKPVLMAVAGALALVAGLAVVFHGDSTLLAAPLASAASDSSDARPAQSPTLTEASLHDAAAPAPSAAPQSPAQSASLPAWAIGDVQVPDQAFAGHVIEIRVAASRRPGTELTEASFEGAELKEVRRTPEGLLVRLTAGRLAQGALKGKARWSFRLTDEDGKASAVVTGSCPVLPGGW